MRGSDHDTSLTESPCYRQRPQDPHDGCGTGTRLVGLRKACGDVWVGALDPDGASVRPLCGLEEFWADPHAWVTTQPTGPPMATTDVELVPPVLPRARVICIGLNYLAHLAEGSYATESIPAQPTVFARWSASLSVGGAPIPIPPGEDGLDWEGEVMAYVGATLVDASPEEAFDAVLGYSTFNDVTARRAQKATSQWTLGKNADGSGPLGPLVPAAEVGDLRRGLAICTRVNGEVVQKSTTDQMVYTVGDTLSLISRTFALRAGDLLATGTPSGVGYARTPPVLMHPGDVVEVEVERLGSLRNTVVAWSGR